MTTPPDNPKASTSQNDKKKIILVNSLPSNHDGASINNAAVKKTTAAYNEKDATIQLYKGTRY